MKEIKEYDYDFSAVVPAKYLSFHQFFDTSGFIIEEIEYLRNGLKAKHRKCEYDSLHNMTSEFFLDANCKVYRTIRYIYEGKLKKQRITLNKDNLVIDKKEYEYINTEF